MPTQIQQCMLASEFPPALVQQVLREERDYTPVHALGQGCRIWRDPIMDTPGDALPPPSASASPFQTGSGN